MSQESHRHDRETVNGFEGRVEMFPSGSELYGPITPEDHDPHSHGHIAQIYESQEEQLAAAISFVRNGLDLGERCMYVGDNHSREEMLTVMQASGIDMDTRLTSGALTFHTFEEIYGGDGTFDTDEPIAFYADSIRNATDEYVGLRVTVETSWLPTNERALEGFPEYERKVNTLLADEDCTILCQFDREGVSPEILLQIIRTHPRLIHDNTACQNVYYTPSDELVDHSGPSRTVDRMLGTLVDRTRSRTEFEAYKQLLRKLNEVTADPDRSFEAKLQALFDLGCDYFELELGAMARVDPENDWFEVEYVSDEHEHFRPGVELPLSETYCTAATEIKASASVSDPAADGYEDITVYEEFGIRAYLGTYIRVDGSTDRTFFFITSDPRDEPFSEEARTFLRVMGQWVTAELKREQREREQQRLYELAADTDRAFEEKLQELFALGCDRFDLEFGAIARIDPETDLFEVEYVGGDHEQLAPNTQVALSKTYCRVLADRGGTVSITDPRESGLNGLLAFNEFGIEAYLGTRIELNNALDRTFFFGSVEPRSEDFSEAEHTFHRLMGQWVKYELERKQRQRDELATLNRIHTLTDDIVRALIDPTSRQELEQTVCEQLIDSPLYTAAWIGARTIDGELSTRCGTIDHDYLRVLTDRDAASGGTGRLQDTIENDDTQVVQHIQESEAASDRMKAAAAERGWEAIILLPLSYSESNYGALVVSSDRPGAFGEREQAALETLVAAVGFAIYAYKQEQLLLADPVVELELHATDSPALFSTLASQFECECRLDSITPGPGKTFIHYYTAETEAPSDRVRDTVESHDHVDRCRIIEQNAECEFEVRVRPTSVLNRLVTAGAAVRTAVADPDEARIVIDISPDNDIREITSVVRDEDPAWRVAAKQQVDRSVKTVRDVRTTLEDLLTAKQRRALQTAYFAGYYDYPRKSTAQDIATSLDITDATLFQHLQSAQHKLITAWLRSTDER